MTGQRLAAVILAAGQSTRMRGFKPLLQIGGKTLVEHVIHLFRGCGVDDVLIVVGHRSEELVPVLEASSSRYAVNDQFREGMFSSVQTGVKNLNSNRDAFFLLPVDIPLVQATTIRRLSAVHGQNHSAPVFYPQHNGRRGHPPLINAQLAETIQAYKGDRGLRGMLQEYEDQAVNVPVNDPFIHIDVDTPEDLSRLRIAYRRGCFDKVPTIHGCG